MLKENLSTRDNESQNKVDFYKQRSESLSAKLQEKTSILVKVCLLNCAYPHCLVQLSVSEKTIKLINFKYFNSF